MKLKQGEKYTIKTEHGEIKNMPQKRKMRYIGSVKAVCGELKVFESCRGGYRETYTAVQWKDCVCHTLDGECVQGEIKVAGEETKRKRVPRIRGGDPELYDVEQEIKACSPHTRG